MVNFLQSFRHIIDEHSKNTVKIGFIISNSLSGVSSNGADMAFSEFELKRIDKVIGGLCRQKTPDTLRDRLRYDYLVRDNDVFITEIRPHWKDPQKKTETGVARLTYVSEKQLWTLSWQRVNLQWAPYEAHFEDRVLDALVKEISEDAFGVFFG